MEIDAVEQRATDAGAVALDLRRGAAALVFRVAKIPTRTGVQYAFISNQRLAEAEGQKRDGFVVKTLTFVSPARSKQGMARAEIEELGVGENASN
jgi:hypothetical protein